MAIFPLFWWQVLADGKWDEQETRNIHSKFESIHHALTKTKFFFLSIFSRSCFYLNTFNIVILPISEIILFLFARRKYTHFDSGPQWYLDYLLSKQIWEVTLSLIFSQLCIRNEIVFILTIFNLIIYFYLF